MPDDPGSEARPMKQQIWVTNVNGDVGAKGAMPDDEGVVGVERLAHRRARVVNGLRGIGSGDGNSVINQPTPRVLHEQEKEGRGGGSVSIGCGCG